MEKVKAGCSNAALCSWRCRERIAAPLCTSADGLLEELASSSRSYPGRVFLRNCFWDCPQPKDPLKSVLD